MPAPANDNFASAQVISGASGSAAPVTIDDATTQASEELTPFLRQTIWYEWTAPADGIALFTIDALIGPGRTGWLTIYTGSALGSLTNATGLSAAASSPGDAILVLEAVSGTTYKIQLGVDDAGGAATGTLALDWDQPPPPANDDFANALVLTANEAVGPIDSVGATVEASEPAPSVMFGSGPYQTTWYEWTATEDASVVLDLTGSIGDSGGGFNEWIIAVWTGASLAALVEVAADDLYGSARTLAFAAVAGTTYRIQVGTWGDYDTATVRLLLVGPAPPFIGRVFVGSPWRLFITDTGSQTLTLLDKRATERQFVYTLNGPASSTGLVASDDPEINIPYPDPESPANLTNNRRLLYALRREDGAFPYPYVCRFGGIVMTLEDDSGDSPTSRYTAYDPWQYLMSRPVRNPETLVLPGPGGLTFPAGSRASDIALNLLLATEINDGITHIDLSTDMIIEDTDPLTEPISFEAGLSVGEAWNRLVLTGTIDIVLPPLYDPENKPGKVCSLWIGPLAGSVRHDVVMGWDSPPRSLTNISRLVDGTRLANRARYFAGQGGLPVPLQSDSASITAYGEYWIQQFFPDAAQNPELVTLLALAEIAIRRNGQRNISFSPAPERSDLVLRDYGLGDFLPVWASKNLREPMQVDYDNPDPSGAGYQRVYQLPVDLDDSGTERVRGIVTVSETTGS